jgi:hypothetical protein
LQKQFSAPRPSEILYQDWDFGLKINHLPTLVGRAFQSRKNSLLLVAKKKKRRQTRDAAIKGDVTAANQSELVMEK